MRMRNLFKYSQWLESKIVQIFLFRCLGLARKWYLCYYAMDILCLRIGILCIM